MRRRPTEAVREPSSSLVSVNTKTRSLSYFGKDMKLCPQITSEKQKRTSLSPQTTSASTSTSLSSDFKNNANFSKLCSFARIVALESTIISHGMPYPQNVACAREVESLVKKQGAIPATIAVIKGIIHVGLNDDELEMLGKLGQNCMKISRRDLPIALAKKACGATTVSGIILIAWLVRIHVMTTGGLGGVHRNVESTFDISADLTELGRTPVLVICAGVKSILDIGKTLEVLETQGVSVIGYKTDEFPAFFTRKSGYKAPLVLQSPDEIAKYLLAVRQLKYRSGGVLDCPVPKKYDADSQVIEAAIQQALKKVNEKKMQGRDITPYVLLRVNELTDGRSLRTNVALVKNNAIIAAQAAVKYYELLKASAKPKARL